MKLNSKLPLKGYIRTNWSQDPFFYGAYSYIAKGSNIDDVITAAKSVANQIYFAGEAMNPKYQSTVHSAYETGENAANEVLSKNHKKVAVIGSGVAGLRAAQALHSKGIEVTVLEGNDRIGGRVWSDDSLGNYVDLGAAFIVGTEGNPVTKLAEEADAERVAFGIDDSEGDIVLKENGEKMWSWFHPSWLETVVIKNSMGTNLENLNQEHAFAGNMHEYFGSYGGGNTVFPQGYQQILGPLQTGYEIKLKYKITAISYSSSGVDVTTESGNTGIYDAAIVTVPLGVLKKGVINFSPALPKEKTDALKRMGMGTVDKLFLFFDEMVWAKYKDAPWIFTPKTGYPRGQFNMWLNQGVIGHNILCAFNPGDAALDLAHLSDEEIVNKALAVLEKAFG